MDGTLDFDCFHFELYTNSLNLCKTLRKYHFRHFKGKSMVNFYISSALCQNFANSESCHILRLVQEAKISNFR